MLIRPATIADAAALSRLGATAFREAFEARTRPKAWRATSRKRSRQRSRPPKSAARPIWCCSPSTPPNPVRLNSWATRTSWLGPDAISGSAPLELKRLYVARAWHGRRVAQALMDAAIQAALARGAQTLWLGVWERNPRAVAFYAKCGFVRVGEHTFMLGSDAQTDWLFARSLTSVGSN